MTVWRFLHDSLGSLPPRRAARDIEIIVLLSEQWLKKLLTLVEKNIALKGTDVFKKKKKKVGLRKGETLFERIIAIRGNALPGRSASLSELGRKGLLFDRMKEQGQTAPEVGKQNQGEEEEEVTVTR